MDDFGSALSTDSDEREEVLTASKSKRRKSPAQEVEAALASAYEALNKGLFEEALPEVNRTIGAPRGSDGLVWARRYEDRQDKENKLAQMALRAANRETTAEEYLVMLGHQMLRVWQQEYGSKKPSRPNYHNREFAEKAKEIGLQVSVPNGREGQVTGDKIELSVIPGGGFEKTVSRLLQKGWDIPWVEIVEASGQEKRGGKRMKLICPRCEDNAQTSTAELICGGCYRETDEIFWMVEEREFVESGAPWVMSEEERKTLRADRRAKSGEDEIDE